MTEIKETEDYMKGFADANTGFADGKKAGYEQGLDEGYSLGWEDGYSQGLADAASIYEP